MVDERRTSDKRATCKSVAAMIADAGFPGVEMYHGRGYYYFAGGIADEFSEQSLGAYHIGTLGGAWRDFVWKLEEAGIIGRKEREHMAAGNDRFEAPERCGKCGNDFDMFDGAEIKGVKMCAVCLKPILDAMPDEDECEMMPVEKIKKGEFVKRKPDAKKTYTRGDYDREYGYQLDDYDDISRCIYVKKGTKLAVGFDF